MSSLLSLPLASLQAQAQQTVAVCRQSDGCGWSHRGPVCSLCAVGRWSTLRMGPSFLPSSAVCLPCLFPFSIFLLSPQVHLLFSWWGCCGLCLVDMNQLSLPTLFYSVLVSVYVFMALSTVSDSMNSPDNPPLSQSVLQVLFLPY